MDCSLLGSSVYGIFPDKNIEVGCYFTFQGIFLTHGIKPMSAALPGGFFTIELPGETY